MEVGAVEKVHTSEAWTIVAISIFLTLLSEGVSYLTVYRTPEHQRAVTRFIEANKRLEKENELVVGADKREKHSKKLLKLETEYKESTAKMNALKFKLNMLIGLFYLVTYRFLSSYFLGRPVARLPFIPLPFFRKLTLRGLTATVDPTVCSFSFVYAISAMAFKITLQKALGFAPPRNDLSKVQWGKDWPKES